MTTMLHDRPAASTVASHSRLTKPADDAGKSSVNVDPVELEKFSQLAHKWWDPNSEFKPLHDINP
ncbi:MAG TPA: hypothetical protein VFW59_09505, partial [Gallionella sp.]|nr:hypothetical protein [Gallionella sp.]